VDASLTQANISANSPQSESGIAPALPNDMFDWWVDSNDAVYLNPIPVRWSADRPRITAENNSGGSF
jgi:hypothetical protein